MADDPDLTGRVRLDLTRLVSGLRYAQAVTRRQIGILVRQANARLRDLDTEPLRRGLTRVAGMIGSLGRLAAPFAAAGAAIGGVLPLLAGLLTSLANMVPAAALAVTGLLAVGLASTTLKIAMSGVKDAVTAALDPSDPKAYAEALKKLSPNARSFVQEIHKAQPALAAIKKSVQEKVFAGLDTQLASTAKTTLPDFRKALDSTAGTLNRMGKGALTAVRGLGKDGTLGIALKGATTGLHEFARAPGQVVTALGQIGAAAGPAFARLSKAGGSALDRLAAKLTAAFESGGMERAIDQAISLIGQLGRVIGNVGKILGAMFGAAQTSGGGFLGVLESVTAEIARIAKTDAVQDALKSLFSVMQTLGQTVAPLLGQALQAIGPVLTTLGPPLQTLIRAIGSALGPVIEALGPVLTAAAGAVGVLVTAFAPLLAVAGQLIAAVLPVLTPLFDALAVVFAALAPVIQQVGDTLLATLAPILAALPGIIKPLADLLAVQLSTALTVLGDLFTALSPSLITLGEAFGALLVAVTPLVTAWAQMEAVLFTKLVPALGPLIDLIGVLVAYFADDLARTITDVVVPALNTFSALLRGDVSGAVESAKQTLHGLVSTTVQRFTELPEKAARAMAQLAPKLRAKLDEAGAAMAQAISKKRAEVVARIAALPGQARAALGDLRSYLVSAGVSLVAGFIAGIQSKIPTVQGVLNSLTNKIPDWKGPKRKDAQLLTPAGKSIIKGLIDGIDSSTSALKSKLTSITNLIERAININKGNRHKVSGLSSLLKRVEKDNKKLLSLAKQRDSVAAKLKAAQTKLNDALKQRADAAAQIKQGILGDANITTGNNVVNSVSAITIGLQQAAAKAKKFAENLSKLRKAGLRTDLLDDIAAAGLDGGAATAEALAKATPAELKKINSLQAELAKSAGKSGATVAGAMYDAGVRAAQGLVDGLKKQQASIEKQMEKIGAAMVKAIKKALKIKSPSRVFMDIGTLTGDGLREGMLRSRTAVAAASRSMAAAAVGAADTAARAMQGVPFPGQLSAAYAGAGMAAGPTTNNFYLQGGDATPDGILRALSWQGLIGRKGR